MNGQAVCCCAEPGPGREDEIPSQGVDLSVRPRPVVRSAGAVKRRGDKVSIGGASYTATGDWMVQLSLIGSGNSGNIFLGNSIMNSTYTFHTFQL